MRLSILPFCLSVFLLLGASSIQAQTIPDLATINADRLRLNQKGMIVLGSWAAGNMAFSGIQMGRTQGSARSFHQMNVWWNAVNLGIAGLGYWGSHREKGKTYDLQGSMIEQKKIEQTLLFNAGLDIGYMAAGLYLQERSRNETGDRQDQFKGWGQSLILQGGFLFVYDLTMNALHQRHGKRGILKVLAHIQPAPMGLGVVIPIR